MERVRTQEKVILKPVINNRLLSLDVFRGITIATMILVNNMGSHEYVYKQLGHSEWNGCTITDMVFPFFLFIIGVSVVFAMSDKKINAPHNKLIFGALRRSFIMIGMSFFLFLLPKVLTDPAGAIKTLRIEGILVRIAIVYFICTIIFLKTNLKTQVAIGISFLIIYWAMLTFIPVPGVGYPNTEVSTNLVAWVDRLIITPDHLLNKTWDPQGLLGTMPACATTIFGVMAGYLLKNKQLIESERVSWLFVLGFIATLAGLLWDNWFPINKALWSSSYVLYTGGLACIGLATCYWLIDVKGYKILNTPFLAFGRNAIIIYFLSEFLPRVMNMIKIPATGGGSMNLRDAISKTLFKPLFSSPYHTSLASGVFYVLVFLALAWWMYRKNIIVKI